MGNGMNKILPGLYVGNFRDAKDEEQLKQNNITHILSIHDNAKELLEDKKYLCIIASDCAAQDLSQYFPECIDFIHKARLANGGVLVHCLAGVSRSVTITAAYIMTVTNFGWRDTLQAIRGARNCANPNFGFQRQLQEYENEGLDKAREKFKTDYPQSPFTDNQDCEILLKSYRNYVNMGDTDSYDCLYMLPHNAYGNKHKRTGEASSANNNDDDDGNSNDNNEDDNDTEQGSDNIATSVGNEEAHSSNNNDVSDNEEDSVKGKELVQKEKWEVTPVPGISESNHES